MSEQHENCWVVEGKLALPYQYFAGAVGSRFLNALRDEKKILGQRCEKCNKVTIPPRATCERCFTDISENWVELSSIGEITGFTVVHHTEEHYPVKTPFVLALIKLDGADVPFAHLVADIAPDAVKIGMKVQAVFADERIGSLMDIRHFKPV
jgi:uncharacterized OB-fold protein